MAEPVEGLSPMTRLICWRSGVTHETWRIVQPLLDAPPAVEAHKPGWWGADKPLSGHPGWRDPWLDSGASRGTRARAGAPGRKG
jgi:glucose-6-phosphate 1-dehydrogenase